MRYEDDINTEHNMKSILRRRPAMAQETALLNRKGYTSIEYKSEAQFFYHTVLYGYVRAYHGVRHGQKSGRANTEYIVYKNYNIVYKKYSIKQVGKNISSKE